VCSEGLNECDERGEAKRKLCYEGRSKAEARQRAVLMGSFALREEQGAVLEGRAQVGSGMSASSRKESD